MEDTEPDLDTLTAWICGDATATAEQPVRRGCRKGNTLGPEFIPPMLEWLTHVGNATFGEYAKAFGIGRSAAYSRFRRAESLGFIEVDPTAVKWGRPATLFRVVRPAE